MRRTDRWWNGALLLVSSAKMERGRVVADGGAGDYVQAVASDVLENTWCGMVVEVGGVR